MSIETGPNLTIVLLFALIVASIAVAKWKG